MLTALTICMALIHSQDNAARDAQTYKFIIQDNGETKEVYGTLHKFQNMNPEMWEITPDTPWLDNPEPIRIRASKVVDYIPERATSRQARHREGWKAHGFTQIVDAQGNTRFASEEEVRYAKAAQQLVQAQAAASEARSNDSAQTSAPETNALDASATDASAGEDAPSLLRQYGPHIAVVAGALLLMVVVVKTLIL